MLNISVKSAEAIVLENDIRIKPMTYPNDFIVEVGCTSNMETGQIIFIEDEKAGEYNYIRDIIDDKRILLEERPISEYASEMGKVYLIEGLKKNIKIENGIICVPYEEFDKNISSAVQIRNMIDETRFDRLEYILTESIIEVSWGMDIRIENIEFSNKNYNLNSIFWGRVERGNVHNCRFDGGQKGILIGTHSNNCSIYGNTIIDCAPGIWIAGSKNLILENTISSSGSTCKEGDGITIGKTAVDNIISENIIMGGNCYGIWGLPGNAKGNTIADNLIDSNITYGIYIQSGKNWTITGNRIIRCAGGIGLENVENSIISCNIIKQNLYCGTIITGKSQNNIIKENVYSENNYIDEKSVGYGGDIVLFKIEQNCNNIIEDNIVEFATKTIK